jgi:hypothetical protein
MEKCLLPAVLTPKINLSRKLALGLAGTVHDNREPVDPRWKATLNAFGITFDGRLSAGRKKQRRKKLH